MACGCGDSSRIATVKGVVTLNGEPVPRGMVQFVPIESVSGELSTATGEIKSDGSYQLQTDNQAGAVVGRHKVRIEARAVPKNEMDTLPASLVPERYTSESTSGLEVTVEPGKSNVLNLELTAP